ncbi:MAG TPA: hypothetical protein VIG54_08580, partial [Lysobacter sp.]
VGARAAQPETHVPAQRARTPGRNAPPPRRSLVRSAILYLLHAPALALEIPADPAFVGLRQPGVPLLVELIRLVHARPDIGVAALVEHFVGREEHEPLQKLAVQTLPGGDSTWRAELLDNVCQLELQYVEQRRGELDARLAEVGLSGMSDAEKREYGELPARMAALKAQVRQSALQQSR